MRIAESLGLAGMHINSISLHIEAEEAIYVECRFFPTKEQVERFADEISELKGRGVIMGDVELFYSSELEEEATEE